MRNGHFTECLDVHNGFLEMGNKMSFHGFSRRISFIRFLWLVCELEKVVMCESVYNVNNKQIKERRVSRISDGLEKCESNQR